MKKERKKKIVTEEVDLSIIKENDLDNTATFTDLMSRKERKKYNKEKNTDTTTFEKKELEDSMSFETEDLASQIAENKTVEIDNDNIKEILKAELESNDDDIQEEEPIEKKHTNIGNIVFISLIIIAYIGLFTFATLKTNFLDENLYLVINAICLILLVFNYCLMTITKNKLSIFFTTISYLLVVASITLNTLIYFKII